MKEDAFLCKIFFWFFYFSRNLCSYNEVNIFVWRGVGGNGGIGAAKENDLKNKQQQQKRINKKDISTLMVDPLSPLGPLNNLDAPDSKKKDEPLQKGS